MEQEKISLAKPAGFVGTSKEWQKTAAFKVLATKCQALYARTPNGKDTQAKYDQTPRRKASHAKSQVKVRAAALAILGGRCKWTGATTDLHIDHIRPIYRLRTSGYASRGNGLNQWIVKHPIEARERLQLLTAECNNFKGTRDNAEAKAAWDALHVQGLLPMDEAA